MKKTLFLLCAALSLFAGSALALGIIPEGDGITMAQPSAPPVVACPVMAVAPPLSERWCPSPSVDGGTLISYTTMSSLGIMPEPSPVAHDTGDPTDSIRA